MTEPHLSRQNLILMDYLNLGDWVSSLEIRHAFTRDHNGAQWAALTKRASELFKMGLIESKMGEYQGCRCAFYRRIDKDKESVPTVNDENKKVDKYPSIVYPKEYKVNPEYHLLRIDVDKLSKSQLTIPNI